MASSGLYPEPYLAAIHRGFRFARELGCRCGTVHLLVGISEGHDQAAAALGPRQGRPLREVVSHHDTEVARRVAAAGCARSAPIAKRRSPSARRGVPPRVR